VKDRKSHFAIVVKTFLLFLMVCVLAGCQGLVAGPRNTSSTSGPSSLSVASANLSWGNVVMGSNQTLTDTVTNSGSSSITISNIVVTGSDFQIVSPSFPLTLAAGQSTTVTVACNPAATGATTATVAITSNASNVTLTINLSATGVNGGRLAASPASFGFGGVNVGSSQTLSGTLTNAGSSSLSVTQASASAGFTLNGITLPLTLAAGQSVPFTVVFQPTQAGAATGALSLAGTVSLATGSFRMTNSRFRARAHDTTPMSMSVPLSGTGMAVGTFSAAPGNLSFGSVQTSKTASLTETLTNSTGSSVTVSNIAATGTGFSVSGITLPATISANASASFSVTYAPQTTGAATGSLAITSNAPNGSLSFALSGTGTATPTGTLSAQSASLSFGSVQTGTSQSLTEVLTNTGGASVTISGATITGTGYTISGLTTPLTVAAGGTASFTVKFAPTAAGTPSGGVTITSNASNTSLSIPVSGTAVAAGALTATPSSVSFGTVQTGSSTQNSVTITNSGSTSITISSASITGTGYTMSGLTTPLTLTAGQTAILKVTLAPTAAGTATGNVAINSNASNATLNIPLTATVAAPGSVTATPSSVSFGSVQVGNTQLVSETLKNPGGTSVTISSAAVTGSAFTVSGLTLPMTLAAGQSFTFGMNYTPTGTGASSGSLLITSNATIPNLTLTLSGTGTSVGALAVNPTALSFGSVTVNNNSALTGQLVATGGSVTVTSIGSNSGEFIVSGVTLPVTVNPGTNVGFTVTFTPQASGAASGNITVASNASNPSLVETVSGTGAAPIQHSVGLTWTASTGTIAGYNVYRGTVSGGPYTKINTALDGATSYTDSSVTSGKTYFYVTTAVDNSSNESSNSNQATAVIPTP
jgi:hypothetical protein